MSLRHWSYVGMLLFVLVGTLPLVPILRLEAARRAGRVATTVAVAALPFVAWDVWATHVGQWRFDPEQTLPWRVFGLPVEELLFFVVVPLAALITYEAVLTVLARRRTPAAPRTQATPAPSGSPTTDSSTTT